jgi:hypothetical protein
VYVLGSKWSGDFVSYLAKAGLGDGKDGYLVDPRTQARAIPWTVVDEISIRFDSPVEVDASDLVVQGVGLLAPVQYEIADFFYNPPTRTARWVLARPVTSDRLTLSLDADKGGVVGTNGQPLDGEWANGNDAYPSGDGVPGGDFNFAVNVLGGDATGDGSVNASDLGQIKLRLNHSVASPGEGASAYSPFVDVTSDGKINALDLGAVKARLNRRLPRAPLPLPVIVAAAPVGGASTSSVTRDLFSDQPLL